MFARQRPETKRRLPDKSWHGPFHVSHDKGYEISGHLNGIGEVHNLLAISDRFRNYRGVRDCGQTGIDNEGGGDHSLEVWLIPAGKSSTGIGRFKLSGCHRLRHSRLVFVCDAVEAAEFVVELATKSEMQAPCSRRDRLGQRELATLE